MGTQCSIALPADVVRALDAKARQQDRSRSSMVRIILTERLRSDGLLPREDSTADVPWEELTNE